MANEYHRHEGRARVIGEVKDNIVLDINFHVKILIQNGVVKDVMFVVPKRIEECAT